MRCFGTKGVNAVLGAIGVVIALLVWSASVEGAEIDSGFLGTKWTSAPTEMTGFVRVGGSGKLSYYADPQRKYTFFGIEVPNQVVYGFYDDKFFAVYIDVTGVDIFYRIKSYIQKKYGPPSKTSREARGDLTTYLWRTSRAQVKFKHYETSGEMKMAVYYTPIARQVADLPSGPPKLGPWDVTVYRELELMTF